MKSQNEKRKIKKILLLILLIIGNVTFSQKIEFLEKNDTLQKPKDKLFVYIFEETDLTTSKFVAKVKSTGKLNEIYSIFQKLENAVQQIGANSFKFVGLSFSGPICWVAPRRLRQKEPGTPNSIILSPVRKIRL